MTDFTVQPGTADGAVRVPASKSVTHRALLLAAHTTGEAFVEHPLRAADTDTTLDCLRRLGATVHDDGSALRFEPADWHAADLDCANSGTTLRLLLGLAARLPGPTSTRFDGDASLRSRPNKPLLDALRRHGARVDGTDALPLAVSGPVAPGEYALPASVSSQYASSLLLSLPFLGGDSTLRMTPPVSSRPYLHVTMQTAAAFGVRVEAEGDLFHVDGQQKVGDARHAVEGDWSGAAFPLVAAAVTGGTVTVEGLHPDSAQGDRAVLDLLRSFGCTVHGTTVTGGALRSPGEVDVRATPDLFPALAVLAACAEGTTTFTGGAALRHKESDRITAMADGLGRLGIEARERPDGLVVAGGRPRGGSVSGYHDHRIHMAFCVAGLAATGPVTVSDAESAAVSYPGFHDHLTTLTEAP